MPGLAIYGPTNVYDGLSAIKKYVFAEGKIALTKLVKAPATDFRDAEPPRLQPANNPERFGNGSSAVDSLANEVNEVHATFFGDHTDGRGGGSPAASDRWKGTSAPAQKRGAGADGRHAGDPLVDGVGACQGADRNGPTALLTSVSGLNNRDHLTAGNTFNIKFFPSTFQEEAGSQAVSALLTTFFVRGGQQVQINVVDAATLRRAQERPWEYEDLLVRVAGFGAKFTTLSQATQDEIISRTEQAV